MYELFLKEIQVKFDLKKQKSFTEIVISRYYINEKTLHTYR